MVYASDPAINPELEFGTVANPTNIGSGGTAYDSGAQTIDGTDLTMTVDSASSATFNVKLEWLDADGNVRREEAPTPIQGVDTISDALITIKGDRVRLKIEDASGSATNNIRGSAKVLR